MPEGYTHLRIARRAAAGLPVGELDAAAFDLGANGPDLLFCYQVWKKSARRDWPLPALGGRMHRERTGAFLQALVAEAKSTSQRSYALGFVCHYAADCALHPYVAFLTEPGRPYGTAGGHGYFEIALDSELHRQDTGSGGVPADHCCPLPAREVQAEVAALLAECVRQVYGLEAPAHRYRAAMVHSKRVRGLFCCRFAPKRWLLTAAEPLFGPGGTVTGHLSPARLKPDLPAVWTHPVTRRTRHAGLPELLAEAEKQSGVYMAACLLFWKGKMSREMLAAVLGDNSYETGGPVCD